MGRKKKRNTRKQTKKRTSSQSFDFDFIAVVVLVVLGILSFLIIYSHAGTAGEILSPALGGILGGIKYAIPFGILGVALAVYREDGKYVKTKLLQGLIFLGCIASVFTIYQFSINNIDKTKGFETVLDASYTLGLSNKGGGTIGAVISYPLVTLFGEFGAAVVSLGLAAVLLVFTFGINITEIIENLRDRVEESRELKEEVHQEREIRREEKIKKRRARIAEEEAREEAINRNQHISPELIPEDQIKINLNNESEEPPKKRGGIKGLLRKSDNTAEIVEISNPNEIENNLFKEQEITKENKTQEVLQLEHNAVSLEDENYEIPPIELLKQGVAKTNKGGKKAVTDTAVRLQKTLYSFGVSAKVENVSVGPAITRYELKPAERR